MRIIEKIVFSNSAPDNTNTLWIDGKDIKIFGSNGWSTLDITENQRLYSLIQEETANREEADTQLLAKINEEISNREDEDEAINITIDTLEKKHDDFVATKGQPDGFAPLDNAGLVPSSHLPSYVDDVIEVYATYDKNEVGDISNVQLYADPEHQTPITGETGKIYINITPDEPNYNFRWSGTQFSPIDTGGLILGEITGTAYDGGKGKHTTDVVNSIPSGMISDLSRTPGSDSMDINVVKYIRGGDGTFTQDIPRTVNIPAATQSTAGVMSSVDKQKLDGLKEGTELETELQGITEDITNLSDKVGSNTYTDANYISKETNLTDAALQLDEEIKATNDNLAILNAATIKGVKVGNNTTNESVANGIVTIANASTTTDGALSKEDKEILSLFTYNKEEGAIRLDSFLYNLRLMGTLSFFGGGYDSYIVKPSSDELQIIPSFRDHYHSFNFNDDGSLTFGTEGNKSEYAVFSSSLSSKDTWDLNDYLDDKFNTGDGTKFLADDFTYRYIDATDIPDLSDKYLPLSGGTITGTLSVAGNTTLGNVTITGNVTQQGDSFITEAETVQVKDNLLVLNNGEAGAGVTAGISGIEVDRGTETNYEFVFDESDDYFKVGEAGDLQTVLTRDIDANLTDNKFFYWDNTNKQAKTRDVALTDVTGIYSSTFNINGTNYPVIAPDGGTSTLTWYAPTTQGEAYQVLMSNGNNTPSWNNINTIINNSWIDLATYKYDSTNGTRFVWNKIGSLPAGSMGTKQVQIRVRAFEDNNYPSYSEWVMSWTIYNPNGTTTPSSRNIYLAPTTYNSNHIDVGIDEDFNIWIRSDVEWSCKLQFRIEYGSSGIIDTIIFTSDIETIDPATQTEPTFIYEATDICKARGTGDNALTDFMTNGYQYLPKTRIQGDLTMAGDIILGFVGNEGSGSSIGVSHDIPYLWFPSTTELVIGNSGCTSLTLRTNGANTLYHQATASGTKHKIFDTGNFGSITFTGAATGTFNGTNDLTINIPQGGGTADSVAWANVTGKPTFATVATSGSYNDLTDKPSIPSAYTLPTASSSVLGGIKVGAGLSISGDGILSATGGGVADSVAWENVVGKPSTFTPSAHTHDFDEINFGNTGSSRQYLAGNGNFYTIAYSEISGTPDLSQYATQSYVQEIVGQGGSVDLSNYVTLDGTQTITGTKTFTQYTVFNAGAGTSSDKRLKRNIKPIENPFEILEGLTGYRYTLISNNAKSAGLIAQDVEKVLPEAVRTDDDGYKSVDTYPIIAVLVETIKELKKEIEELKSRL